MQSSPLPELADHFLRASLRMRGFRARRVATSVGPVACLEAPGRGELPPIVLLHGFSSAGVHYAPILRALRSASRRIVLPDLPGHGRSCRPAAGVTAQTVRTGLVEALDALIDEPSIVFGNSMGGYAALAYAARRPERVAAVVAVSPSGAPIERHELPEFLDRFRIDTHDKGLAFVDRLYAEPTRMRHLLAWGIRQKFNRPEQRSLIDSLTPETFFAPGDLEALRMPVLLLWGRQERILPASGLAFYRRHLPPHAVIEEPEGFGHSPFLEVPARVQRRTLAFLRAQFPEASLGPAPIEWATTP